MATIITTDRWPARADKWEPPYDIVVGIQRATVGAQTCTLSRVVVPPDGGNQYHIHQGADALGFVVRGRFRNEIGGDVVDIAAGDFWHFAMNERHWSHNLSKTDICMMIAAYTHASSLDDTRTAFLDPALAPALASAPEGQLPEPGRYGEPARSRILERSSMTVETEPGTGIVTTWGASRENSNTDGGISLCRVVPVGIRTSFVAIENAETAAFVLDGKVAVEAGEPATTQEAPAGSFIFVPFGEPYRLTSIGAVPAELYVVLAGPGVGHRDDLRVRAVEAAAR